jgi:hypothetical protein
MHHYAKGINDFGILEPTFNPLGLVRVGAFLHRLHQMAIDIEALRALEEYSSSFGMNILNKQVKKSSLRLWVFLCEKIRACSFVWNGKNLMKYFPSKQVPRRIANPFYLDSKLLISNSGKISSGGSIPTLRQC